MLFRSFLLASALGLSLTACSIHPSPKDVMPHNTLEIVDRIKCETRFAIIDKALDKLENNDVSGEDGEKLRVLATRLRGHDDEAVAFPAKDLPGKKAKEFRNRYINASIAFEFSLISFEDNSNSTEVDFARVITNGTVSVPFSASNDRMRQSTKTFLISESFMELLQKTGCQRSAETPNLEFPVSGHIGIYDIISTFIDLNEEKNLTPKPSATGLYADSLVFTTTAIGSVVPRLVLTPPTHAFHLTGAMLNSSATRKETDTVNIGLSLPAPKTNKKTPNETKSSAVNAIYTQRYTLVQNSVIQFLSSH